LIPRQVVRFSPQEPNVYPKSPLPSKAEQAKTKAVTTKALVKNAPASSSSESSDSSGSGSESSEEDSNSGSGSSSSSSEESEDSKEQESGFSSDVPKFPPSKPYLDKFYT